MNRANCSFSVMRNVLLAGGAGLILRLALYRFGFDSRGLLPRMHIFHLTCLLLTLGVAVYTLLHCKQQSPASPAPDFRQRLLAGAAGGFLLLNALSLTAQAPGSLSLVRLILAFGAMGGVFLLACLPNPGPLMSLVCHGALCLFFLVDMVCRYQSWSGNPQLPDYLFHVPACVCLVLASYYRMAAPVGLAKPRTHCFCSLMAGYLCLLALAGPEPRVFYLAGLCWAWAGIAPAAPAGEEA